MRLSSIGSGLCSGASARGALDVGRDGDVEAVVDNDPREHEETFKRDSQLARVRVSSSRPGCALRRETR